MGGMVDWIPPVYLLPVLLEQSDRSFCGETKGMIFWWLKTAQLHKALKTLGLVKTNIGFLLSPLRRKTLPSNKQ
jgi:hypothetical protein